MDETDFPKKGRASCGVAPQYCGSLGRSANAQVEVFLAYTSDKGLAFIGRTLYPQQPAVGRRRHDHRTVLSGILWVLRSAAPWREMPVHFGKWNTAYVRYRLWRTQGLWQRIIDALGPDAVPPARARPP